MVFLQNVIVWCNFSHERPLLHQSWNTDWNIIKVLMSIILCYRHHLACLKINVDRSTLFSLLPIKTKDIHCVLITCLCVFLSCYWSVTPLTWWANQTSSDTWRNQTASDWRFSSTSSPPWGWTAVSRVFQNSHLVSCSRTHRWVRCPVLYMW